MLKTSTLKSGTVIGGDFEIESVLGHGNMAVVYKARQISLNRPVALKILYNTLEDDEASFLDIFTHEIRSAALMVHPNLIHAVEAGEDHGRLFFVMEYVKGQSLKQLQNTSTLPSVAELIQIMGDIASALDYGVRKFGLTHGDIKPDNIMVTNQGVGKLADFGLAQTKTDTRREAGIFVTPLYAAPETVMGQVNPGSPLADIYSFGCTMFHLLSGEPPFPGTDPDEVCRLHTTTLPPSLEEKVSGLPQGLYDLVNQCLLKKRSRRPHSWEEVSKRLYGLLEGHKGYKPRHKVVHINNGDHAEAMHKMARRYAKPRKGGAKLAIIFLTIVLTALGATYALLKQEEWRSVADFKKVEEKVPTYKSPENAVKYIENYLTRYKDKAVPEARSLLKKYQEKARLSTED